MTPHRRDEGRPGSGRARRRRGPWWRRLGRGLGLAALVLVALLAVSTVVNLALVQHERSSIAPYGRRVPVGAGALNVVDNGRDGLTVVLLSGLGTPAPGLDFAPLVRELDGYRVVVVEGFGYGYSDLQAPERTARNVSEELHAALSVLEVEEPYVLVGHSLGGFYTLDYADRYPGEVAAVVGIDPTVPAVVLGHGTDAQDGAEAGGGTGIPWQRLPATTGLLRWTTLAAPDLVLPDGAAHTEDERRRIRLMTAWNWANPALQDETRRIGENARALEAVAYPGDLPVLALLAQDTVDRRPEWLRLHEEQLGDAPAHEIVVLDGGHYLHWTRSPEITEAITGFLERHEVVGEAGRRPASSSSLPTG